MYEAKILSALVASRKDYDMIEAHIDREDMGPLGLVLLEHIDDYYARDVHADEVDFELLKLGLDRRFKDIPKHQEKMHDYLLGLELDDTSSINVVTEVLEQKRAKVMTQLADACLSQETDRIHELMGEYEELTDRTTLEANVEEVYIGTTLAELEEQFDTTGAWELAPLAINERIRGGLRPGHQVFIAARPERGKTLFAINAAGGFLQQGALVLYIGNEDPVPDLILRLLSNLTGMCEEDMMRDKDKAMKIAIEKGYERCVFAGLSPGNLYDIEALVRRHEPNILIVDQMRNIRSATTENNTQRLEVVAQELRNIARKHNCVSVAMTQVGDSGRDRLELNDGDIDGSNTGIPGACDVIVMVGSNEDYELRDLRRVTLAKNKRGGDHGSFNVRVNRDLSRVVSHV